MKVICLLLIFIVLKAQNETKEETESQRLTCLNLIRDYLYEHSQQLEKKMQNQSVGTEEFFKRYIIYIVQRCESLQNTSDSVSEVSLKLSKFIQSYEKDKKTYIQEVSSHLENQLIDMDSELSENQNQIYEDYLKKEESQAFYLFGYNLKRLPKRAKVYYLIVYALIVAFALYNGLKDIEINSKPPKRD